VLADGAAGAVAAAWLASGGTGAATPGFGPEPRLSSKMPIAATVITKTTAATTLSTAARLRRPGTYGAGIDCVCAGLHAAGPTLGCVVAGTGSRAPHREQNID